MGPYITPSTIIQPTAIHITSTQSIDEKWAGNIITVESASDVILTLPSCSNCTGYKFTFIRVNNTTGMFKLVSSDGAAIKLIDYLNGLISATNIQSDGGVEFIDSPIELFSNGTSWIGGKISYGFHDSDVPATGISDTKLDTISTNGKVANSATTATNTNTADAIVTRDASGDFIAGSITSDTGIITDTITEKTLLNGVSIEGCLIKDGAVALANSVATGAITNDMIEVGTIEDSRLATISSVGKVANSATTATDSNEVNAIVARDASGGFTAGELTLTNVVFDEGGTEITKGVRGPTIDTALAIPYVLVSFTGDSFVPTYGPIPFYEGSGGAFVDGKPAAPALGRAYDNQGTARLDWGTQLNATLDGLSEYTFCCWANFNALSGSIIHHQDDSANRFTLQFSGSNLRWLASSTSILGGTALSTGVWYWICVVQAGGVASIYINNVLDGIDNSVGNLNTSALYSTAMFSRGNGESTSNCILDDVSIYTTGISDSQRAAIFANGGNGSGDPSTALSIARWEDNLGNRLLNSGVLVDNSGVLYPGVDGVQDCGSATNRWNDIYATNATIQTSDINQKRDIIPLGNLIQDPKAFIMSLQPVIFKWKDFQYYDPIDKAEKTKTHTRNHFGLIAQEVEDVLDSQGIDKAQFAAWTRDEATGLQGLRYMEFVPILIKANQQLISAVSQMNLTITALEARISALENP